MFGCTPRPLEIPRHKNYRYNNALFRNIASVITKL